MFKDGSVGVGFTELTCHPAFDLIYQHPTIDDAEAVLFGEVFDLDDGFGHGEERGKDEETKRLKD